MSIRVHALHALLLVMAGWAALSLRGVDDLAFLLRSRESTTVLVLDTRALFPRGTQYYEVTVKFKEGAPFVLDAHVPDTAYSSPPSEGATMVVQCVVGAAPWCRPLGWYYTGWRVLWKFAGVILTLLACLLYSSRVQAWGQRKRVVINTWLNRMTAES